MNGIHCLTRFTAIGDYDQHYVDGKLVLIMYGGDEKLLNVKLQNGSIYNPLEETKELYLELNKVEFEQPETLLKFINTYGLPTGRNVDEGNKDVKVLYRMMMEDIELKLFHLKEIIEAWDALQTNNIEEMEKFKGRFELHSSLDQVGEYIVFDEEIADKSVENNNLTTNSFKLWLESKHFGLKDTIKAYITSLLNEQQLGEYKTVLIDVATKENNKVIYKKRIVDAVSFNDLFEVAFFQLRQLILKEMNFRRCDNCQSPFEPVHERQRFCSPLFGRKRSTCENTFNQRIKRQRQKEKEL
jgi:hypothetical protein